MSSPHVQLHVKLSGFQNPESLYLWMLESLALESGMQVPMTKYPESSTRNPQWQGIQKIPLHGESDLPRDHNME